MALELPLGLPRMVVLKNKYYNGKYLRYTYEDTNQQGLLQFTGEEILNQYAKFHVEPSTTSDDMVHIRCAYNNKYWRRSQSSNFDYWIGAFADSPEEDQSKWSCTLFKPELVESDGDQALLVRFLYVQYGRYVRVFTPAPGDPHDNFLFAGSQSPTQVDICEVVDRESFPVLPPLVAFKGLDGAYVRATLRYSAPLAVFSKDIGAEGVGHEVYNTPGGAVRIKNIYTGHFWRLVPQQESQIWPTSSDTSDEDPRTVFWPVKIDDNFVALRCQGNNNFCMRRTYDNPDMDAFVAQQSTISQQARFQVEELVMSREIYDVKFRLQDARVYDENIILAANADVSNDGPNPLTQKVILKHTETTTNTWQGNVTFKLGVKTKIKTGIPFLADGQIEVSAEASRSTTWGDTHSTSNELTNEYDAEVSPYSNLYVKLLATQGSCDVPFSYTQRDVKFDGTIATTQRDDGLFIGVNSYNYHYETREEPLPDKID